MLGLKWPSNKPKPQSWLEVQALTPDEWDSLFSEMTHEALSHEQAQQPQVVQQPRGED